MAAEEMPEPIQRDVGLLGRLLGRVLEESGGTELLADVERLRRASIARREEPTEERRQGLEPETLFSGSTIQRLIPWSRRTLRG